MMTRLLENTWSALAGSAGHRPIDFQNLKRPSSPNYYLVCPDGYCPKARPNRTAPVFTCPATELQEKAQRVWRDLPGVELVSSDTELLQDRYVKRSSVLRFPDVITVRFIDLDDGTSSLALYSRSLIGYTDFGANKKRVIDWLSRLENQADT